MRRNLITACSGRASSVLFILDVLCAPLMPGVRRFVFAGLLENTKFFVTNTDGAVFYFQMSILSSEEIGCVQTKLRLCAEYLSL